MTPQHTSNFIFSSIVEIETVESYPNTHTHALIRINQMFGIRPESQHVSCYSIHFGFDGGALSLCVYVLDITVYTKFN